MYFVQTTYKQLSKNAKKVNSVERLTRHLNKGRFIKTLHSYLSVIRKRVPATQLRNQRKDKIHFHYYRLAKGIAGIVAYAKKGARL